jgi:glycosyltransferase involved in cell wall biosynthesis
MALRGSIDLVTHDRFEGWAWDDSRPDSRVSLVVLADGAIVARCLADRFRPDLLNAKIGDGKHAFGLRLHKGLSAHERHTIELRREEDGTILPGSPKIVETSAAFDKNVAEDFARVLAAAESEEDFDRRMAFLLDQTEKLRRAYSQKQSGALEREKRRQLQWQDPVAAFAGEASPGAARPLALVVDDRLPDLGRDAGSKAIISHMQSLQRLGFEVNFTAPDMRGDPRALEALGVKTQLKPWVNSVEEVLERQAGAYRLVYLHRLSNASLYLWLVRKHQPRARIIYALADLHHLRLAREAAVEKRDDLRLHSEWVKRQELWIAAQADTVVTHSIVERDIMWRHLPAKKIIVAPWHVAPEPATSSFADRGGVGFVAHFSHRPNIDAAHFLIESIMPAVWAIDPSIACFIAGTDLPDNLRQLAGARVRMVGAVENLNGFFHSVRLTIAPLAFGAGVKGKVLDSMAAGAPCVCTPVAAEGLNLPASLANLVRETSADLAEAIVALHNDESLNREAAVAGLDFIKDFASESRVDAALAEAAGMPAGPRPECDGAGDRLKASEVQFVQA